MSDARVVEESTVARRALRVRGTVQGVGFRPMVYRVARAASLSGFVRNDGGGVTIEIEGAPSALAGFPELLRHKAPPLARIEAIEVEDLPPRGDRDFLVVASAAATSSAARAVIPADTATCAACLEELFDPAARRFRHAFVTCTDCGPRYTIILGLPYDRSETTMARFEMCEACRAEYEDPGDRRFHAEPIACPACGPKVSLAVRGEPVASGDAAILRAGAMLARGAIVALKGLGGYQLAADARSEAAVSLLRERKKRPHKPFALMARDVDVARRVANISSEALSAMTSPARPIVLIPAARDAEVAPSVAPGLFELGVMLPTTPLHHLLLAASPPLLVMTSGNLSEEPIAKDDDAAFGKLGHIADAFLVHDRPIHTRADDSVVRVVAGAAQPVRRARGLAPDPIPLGVEAPPVLAVGAELKNAVCLARGGQAFLSQHIGDLGSTEARLFFEEVVAKLSKLLGARPELVAHDLHPDYASTRWALASGLPVHAVQHHHAHVAACLAEHGQEGPAIGVAFDGTGCGPAGELWGGEFLVFDLEGFTRAAHLRPLPLPGAEAAIREPWRLGVAALHDAGEPVNGDRAAPILRLIDRRYASPLATGAGRWFDAVAAILGVRELISYEAQAAIELESLAAGSDDGRPYPFAIEREAPVEIDLRPAIRAVASDLRRDAPRAGIASRFYATMAHVVLEGCRGVRASSGLRTVALSGGCFQSVLLSDRATSLLTADGFEVLVHRKVPPNDGGVAFGQAVIAARALAAARSGGSA